MSKRDRPNSDTRSVTIRPGARWSAPRVGMLWVAAAATGFVILSDDARVLRLGLVAALWVALFGAFAVARLQRRVSMEQSRAAEQQRVYERSLESEITARQEFEARVETEVRREVAAEYDAELHMLRTELNRLRVPTGHSVRADAAASEQLAQRQLTSGSADGAASDPVVEHAPGSASSNSAGADSAAEPAADDAENARSAESSAHTTGTSVTELLAAYGDSGTRPGRRRRRS